MAQEPNAVEQAVSRAVRDNLAALQRGCEELQQALSDLSAACSSSRPTNALPALLRAQSTAASLAASLEVMARFIAGAAQPMSLVAAPAMAPGVSHPAPVVGSAAVETAADAGREMAAEGGPPPIPTIRVPEVPPPEPMTEAPAAEAVEPAAPAAVAEVAPEFDVRRLPAEEQELHRRASRVAKVSMQDIKMLRPDDVKQGRKNKDLCARLKVDIDKARKEYDRRFKAILNHPVDYFYDWMVDILADGDPSALGEYPYPRSTGR